MNDWLGKVVLVTGGSDGLGRAVAEAFAREGAKLVIAARGAQRLEAAAVSLRRLSQDVLAIPADVTRQEDVDAVVGQALAQFGRLDVLVNNAGRSDRGEVLSSSIEDFQRLMDVNFLSVVRCTRAAAEHLIKARGHLVNIGSLAAKSASRYVGAYPATKFAVAAYTQQLRLELGPRGLHVLLVCPGPIAQEEPRRNHADRLSGLPERAGKPGAGVRMRLIDPHKLARAILQACRRRRPELIIPRRARLYFVLSQLSPRLGDWIVRRMT
jgi:NAD(P)-dependent dehydrogenase (short-subunit alcohol dehydrogenase family)